MTEPTPHSRRTLLKAGLTGAAATLVLPSTAFAAAPLLRGDRPVLTHGVQSGDVTPGSAIVWSRADRPSRLVVEIARDPSFRHARRVPGPPTGPPTGGTGQVRVAGLAPGTEYHYRVTAESLDGRAKSEPLTGRFATAPVGRRDTRILWSGDVVGQNWGINPDLGGMTIFSAMAARRPDLFLHSGDTVYADGPLTETVALPGGRTWRNVVTAEKAKVAETLDEYRGQHAYNRLDANFKRFAAQVPVYAQWDDHQTRQLTTVQHRSTCSNAPSRCSLSEHGGGSTHHPGRRWWAPSLHRTEHSEPSVRYDSRWRRRELNPLGTLDRPPWLPNPPPPPEAPELPLGGF